MNVPKDVLVLAEKAAFEARVAVDSVLELRAEAARREVAEREALAAVVNGLNAMREMLAAALQGDTDAAETD